jgi:uncharacterized membrane protein
MSRRRGQMEAILSALCFGIAPIFAKKGLVTGLHPFYGGIIANGSALVLMILFILLTGHGRQWGSFNQRSLFFIFLSGMCNTIALITLFGAMSIGKIALVIPMTCIYPLFTLLAAYILMRESESIDRFTVIGTFLIVIGVILTL